MEGMGREGIADGFQSLYRSRLGDLRREVVALTGGEVEERLLSV